MSKFDAANVTRMERMYASAPIAEQRAKTCAALAPRAGEYGLEVGCGIGFLACEIARDTAEYWKRGSLNRRYETNSFSAGLIDTTPKIVTRFGIDAAEAEAWVQDLRSRTGEDDYFFSLNRYLFVASKNEP